MSQDTRCNPEVHRFVSNNLQVSQGTQCNGFSDSATDAEYGPSEPPESLDAALPELQTVCEVLQSPNFSRMGAPISSELLSSPGLPAPDRSPEVFTFQEDFVGLLEKTISNIEMHLEQLYDSLNTEFCRISAQDFSQQCTNRSIAESELGISQVRVAAGYVVWQSIVSDTRIHYTELQNLRLKRCDFSAEGSERRCKTSLQISRCISAPTLLLKTYGNTDAIVCGYVGAADYRRAVSAFEYAIPTLISSLTEWSHGSAL